MVGDAALPPAAPRVHGERHPAGGHAVRPERRLRAARGEHHGVRAAREVRDDDLDRRDGRAH